MPYMASLGLALFAFVRGRFEAEGCRHTGRAVSISAAKSNDSFGPTYSLWAFDMSGLVHAAFFLIVVIHSDGQ